MGAPKLDYLSRELERLAELHSYSILDTPPEIPFDEITRLAAAICNVPIALISLVDEHRQWFKSRVGLPALETPREVAFCAHAIQGDELFEVKNALEDVRFSSNPLVIDNPNIRFYAGAPLKTPRGNNLGTLCVIDAVPRELNAQQREGLEILSHHVVNLLETRKLNDQLRQTQLLLRNQQDLLIHKARMQTAGELSGGICHQINNPVAIIIGRSMILKTLLEQEKLERQDEIYRQLNVIDETSTRISEIIRSLKTIASEDYSDVETFSLPTIVNEVLVLCKPRLHALDIQCMLVLESEGSVTSNRKILSQALFSLFNNSFEALEEANQKIMEVRVFSSPEGVHLQVSDSGRGILPQLEQKIFEPFFTTKVKNFGMGLSLAKKSLQEIGAKLTLKKPRELTTFEILIPKGKT